MMSKQAPQHKKKNKKSSAVNALLIVSIFAAVTSFGLLTVSKYVSQSFIQSFVESEKFYFTSNFLKEDNPVYSVYGDRILFTINNNDGLNYTGVDIQYNLEVDGGGLMSEAGDNTILGGVIINREHTLIGTAGQSYTVTAHSSFPYEKTIKATFEFKSVGDESYYRITDMGTYVELDLYIASDVPQSIAINYGTELAPDNTNELMRSWQIGETGNSMTSGLESHSLYKLYFFKTSQREYTNVSKGNLSDNSNTITIS